MDHSQRSWNRQSNKYVALAAVVLLAVLGWFSWPSKVKLSPDTYEIAIALYRVCNQQDMEGLQQIQSQLSQRSNPTDADNLAINYLQCIVEEARAGNWKTAMRQTRDTLEDQTATP
jgi:hypothetical protein